MIKKYFLAVAAFLALTFVFSSGVNAQSNCNGAPTGCTAGQIPLCTGAGAQCINTQEIMNTLTGLLGGGGTGTTPDLTALLGQLLGGAGGTGTFDPSQLSSLLTNFLGGAKITPPAGTTPGVGGTTGLANLLKLKKEGDACDSSKTFQCNVFVGLKCVNGKCQKQSLLGRLSGTPVPSVTAGIPGSCPTRSRGDADCSGVLTPNDFEIWRSQATGEAPGLEADFNGNGRVVDDIDDFEIFRANYNNELTGPTLTPAVNPTGEPGTEGASCKPFTLDCNFPLVCDSATKKCKKLIGGSTPVPTVGPNPTDVPVGTCVAGKFYAKNSVTGQCSEFANTCDIPATNWQRVSSCPGTPTTGPTSNPTAKCGWCGAICTKIDPAKPCNNFLNIPTPKPGLLECKSVTRPLIGERCTIIGK